MTTTNRQPSALLATVREWSTDPRRDGSRLPAWVLAAVPVGVLLGVVAVELSRLVWHMGLRVLPGPLALWPGLLVLLLALLVRATDAVVHPMRDELWGFVLFAGVASLLAFVVV